MKSKATKNLSCVHSSTKERERAQMKQRKKKIRRDPDEAGRKDIQFLMDNAEVSQTVLTLTKIHIVNRSAWMRPDL